MFGMSYVLLPANLCYSTFFINKRQQTSCQQNDVSLRCAQVPELIPSSCVCPILLNHRNIYLVRSLESYYIFNVIYAMLIVGTNYFINVRKIVNGN